MFKKNKKSGKSENQERSSCERILQHEYKHYDGDGFIDLSVTVSNNKIYIYQGGIVPNYLWFSKDEWKEVSNLVNQMITKLNRDECMLDD